MRPEVIWTGGQRGADHEALLVARGLGIPTGGIAAKGWKIQLPDGTTSSDPGLAEFGLVESAPRIEVAGFVPHLQLAGQPES